MTIGSRELPNRAEVRCVTKWIKVAIPNLINFPTSGESLASVMMVGSMCRGTQFSGGTVHEMHGDESDKMMRPRKENPAAKLGGGHAYSIKRPSPST